MSFEGIIATPFGYLLDGLYQLTSNYGLALIIFAILVQAIMVPLGIKNRRDKEKKQRLKPIIAQLREEYKDDVDKQTEVITELYNKEKVSLAGGFILSILPFFILVAIFQAVAQPITYLFHETPETAEAIVKVIREEAPELYVSGYNQVTAITHIQDYAEIVKAKVPEVSPRTLEGLDYSFLGLNLGAVPGVHVLGKSTWAWDWAHIGVILVPILYMARRIYTVFAGMFRSLMAYSKAKKEALKENKPVPKLPNPPLLQLFFLLLSLTALFAVPIAMNLYWLVGGIASSFLHSLARKAEEKRVVSMKEN